MTEAAHTYLVNYFSYTKYYQMLTAYFIYSDSYRDTVKLHFGLCRVLVSLLNFIIIIKLIWIELE